MMAQKRKRLTWKQLDACDTPADIAYLLEQHGFKGVPYKTGLCPLANATGWLVYNHIAANGRKIHTLTSVESDFVKTFDAGGFQELQETASKTIELIAERELKDAGLLKGK